jgi:hypothetical protein
MPLSSKIVKQYMNRVFVETGSYMGDGIQAALDAGCDVVKSVDLSIHQYNECVERFKGNSKVELHLGDVETKIWEMIADVKEPITFWLDAHGGAAAPDEQVDPVYETLKVIAKHPIKTHTILIDDQDLSPMTDSEIEADLDSSTDKDRHGNVHHIKSLILKINPKYKLKCIDSSDCYGHVYKKFVIAATLD